MLEHRKNIGSLSQGNEIRLDDQRPVARMPKKLILMPCPCSPALTNVASRTSSKLLNSDVTGTCRARDRDCSEDNDGEVAPFSIFESMPADICAAFANSLIVMLSFSRKRLTSRPIDSSSRLFLGPSWG